MSSIIFAVLGWRMTSQTAAPGMSGMLQLAAIVVPIVGLVGGSIGAATARIFRAGERRQAERNLRDNFARLERRLSALEHEIELLARALTRVEATMAAIDARLARLEQQPHKEAA